MCPGGFLRSSLKACASGVAAKRSESRRQPQPFLLVLPALPNRKRTRSEEDSPVRDSFRSRSLLRPVVGGVLFAVVCLYISGLDFTATTEEGRHGFPQGGQQPDSDAAVLNPPSDSYPFDPGGRNAEHEEPRHRMSSQVRTQIIPGSICAVTCWCEYRSIERIVSIGRRGTAESSTAL